MSQRRVVRTFDAPTRSEVEVLAAPVIAAFGDTGWTEQERLWIPAGHDVDQQYLPDDLVGRRCQLPSDQGYEKANGGQIAGREGEREAPQPRGYAEGRRGRLAVRPATCSTRTPASADGGRGDHREHPAPWGVTGNLAALSSNGDLRDVPANRARMAIHQVRRPCPGRPVPGP